MTEAQLRQGALQLQNAKNTLQQREVQLKTTQEGIIQQKAQLQALQLQLEQQELQARHGFPALFEESFAPLRQQLAEREQQCAQAWEHIEQVKEQLRQRELSVQHAEIARDKGFSDERSLLEKELFALQQQHKDDLDAQRTQSLLALNDELAKEKSARQALLKRELDAALQEHEKTLQDTQQSLNVQKKRLMQEQAQLETEKEDVEYQQQRLQARKVSLEEREKQLDKHVQESNQEYKRSLDAENAVLTEEVARLRESLTASTSLVGNFEALQRKLDNRDPAEVLLTLKTHEEDIASLRNELASRPTQAMQDVLDRLHTEQERLQGENEHLREENTRFLKAAKEQAELEMQIADLSQENTRIQRRFDLIDAENRHLQEELRRLHASYEREQEREARISDLEMPYIEKSLPRAQGEVQEIDWLYSISNACMEYGLRFPKRILYAFHTALKTSEWSPITVLAGVSGTGKSELPRLYSHFGGINFLSLSVQPNWDSQESMLGFFNSIDNKFDAQPVLRLLAQSQKKATDDYLFGLHDSMNLILMDEMNLAHVELYFAEFLSKLELRRGRKRQDVPSLEVKLGAGIAHYNLPLGRNVLWVGTMNQDETTKSLSDKVLDRGIVINFPRPTRLERRRELKNLPEQSPLLARKLWEKWWCKESLFQDEQIMPFKSFVEEMNTSLAKVGRALGHRVWQSIEYYMANYPEVLAAQNNNDESALLRAMKIAFEDQLVQKVMPKLRGIETRGHAKTDCLDKIRNQLMNNDYNIVDDFDLACTFGYGQFIWNSANYLKDDLVSETLHEEVTQNVPEAQQSEGDS